MSDVPEDPLDPRLRLQRRALALIRAVQPGGDAEAAIPETARQIDLLHVVEEPSEAWGILSSDLAHRPLVLEHFSAPPSRQELAGSLLRAAWAVEEWFKGRWSTRRPPLTLVLSVGRPDLALGFFGLLQPTETTGVYRTRDPGLELILVDVRRLDPGRQGTAFLRLFDHRHEAVRENLPRSLRAPELYNCRHSILEAIMNEPTVFDPLERRTTLAEIHLLAARRHLEQVLTARFGPAGRAFLAEVSSAPLEELEPLIGRAAVAASLDELRHSPS